MYVHKLIHEFEVSSYQYIFSLKIFVRTYLSLLKAIPFEYSEKAIQFSLPLNVIWPSESVCFEISFVSDMCQNLEVVYFQLNK